MIPRLVAAIAACFASAAMAADPAPAVTREFKVSAESDVKLMFGKKTIPLTVGGELGYAWTRQGDDRTLLLRRFSAKVAMDGREQLAVKASRASFSASQNGERTEAKFEDASDEVKQMLRDTFDTPLCKLRVDATGRELKRTVLAAEGAKELVDDAMIANLLLFHPPFPADKNEWTEKVAVSSGTGMAKGDFTFTKVAGGKGGQAVKVTGTLNGDDVKTDFGFTVKTGKYIATGTLLYDLERKEWVSGKLDLDMSIVLVNDKQTVPAKGKMTLTFEMLPEKK